MLQSAYHVREHLDVGLLVSDRALELVPASLLALDMTLECFDLLLSPSHFLVQLLNLALSLHQRLLSLVQFLLIGLDLDLVLLQLGLPVRPGELTLVLRVSSRLELLV